MPTPPAEAVLEEMWSRYIYHLSWQVSRGVDQPEVGEENTGNKCGTGYKSSRWRRPLLCAAVSDIVIVAKAGGWDSQSLHRDTMLNNRTHTTLEKVTLSDHINPALYPSTTSFQ